MDEKRLNDHTQVRDEQEGVHRVRSECLSQQWNDLWCVTVARNASANTVRTYGVQRPGLMQPENGRGGTVESSRRDRVLGLGNRPEPVTVLDEAVFLEALQCRAHAPLGDVDSVDDLPLAERLVSVLEKKAIDRTLGGVGREVGE